MLRQEIHEIEGFRVEVTRNETRRSPDGRLAPGVTVIVAEPTAGGPDRLPRPLLVEHYPAPGCTITSYDEQAHLVGVQFAWAEGGVWQSWLAPRLTACVAAARQRWAVDPPPQAMAVPPIDAAIGASGVH